MADRYWVGGTGTWGTTTTNWAATSGGASGASVPTAADNVFFDVNSNTGTGAFTVTMANSPRVCNDLTISGLDGAMTLAGSSIGLTISGSLLFPATNLTISYSGETTFNATTAGKTITANGKTFNSGVTFNGIGGVWTFGSAFNCSSFVTHTNGTIDTSSVGNYAFTWGQLSSYNSNVRTLNLNASTCNTGSFTPGIQLLSTNYVFNAGTSTINFNGTNATGIADDGAGVTFYNVVWPLANSSVPITGAHTFNNFTVASRTSLTSISTVTFTANITINGTLTVTASTGAPYRTLFASTTLGTARTLTCASIAAMSDIDFRDITIAGAHGTLSGTRLGDCKGNTNITFPAAKTVYYGQTGSANWGTAGSGSWSATSGGALDATQFPLPQDTAVFPAATYPASGSTTTIQASYNIGTIDMSLRTSNTMTLATGGFSPAIYGNWINGTGITLSGTATITFIGRTTQQITSAGRSFTQNFIINSPSGTVQLQDALTISVSTRSTTLTSGTLDLQSFTFTTGLFGSTNLNIRTIAFGTGNITCTGVGTLWTNATNSGLTTTGTQVVNVTSTGSTAITVNTGVATEANSISFNFTGGTYALTFLNTTLYSARSVNFTGYAGTLTIVGGADPVIYGDLTFSTGMTISAGSYYLIFGATSGIQKITWNNQSPNFLLQKKGAGTFQLQDNLTLPSIRDILLSAGTLDLNNFTASIGTFNSNNTSTRTIAFGTGNITITGTGTAWHTGTTTNLTITGTPVVNVTSTGSSAITVNTGVLSEANSISFNFTGGTYSLSFLNFSSYTARNVDFTGFSGTWAAIYLSNPVTIFGNLTLSSTMTVAASGGQLEFGSTSGTKTITSNGKTIDFAIAFVGIGGTWECQDALTLGSTRSLTMTRGTLKLKDGVTSTVGSFVTTGTNLKYLQSKTAGVQATLSDLSGTNTVTYLSIKDSNATGGASFIATSPTNVDAGNNTGWVFVLGSTGSFLMFF